GRSCIHGSNGRAKAPFLCRCSWGGFCCGEVIGGAFLSQLLQAWPGPVPLGNEIEKGLRGRMGLMMNNLGQERRRRH
ncbi:unnamed protein product, partial [Amoebophrya sp. A25]